MKSKNLTPDQMTQIDKEEGIHKAKEEKNKVAIERGNIILVKDVEEGSSCSSMSMYILDSEKEDSNMPSHQSPTVILHDAPLRMHLEEVHSSPVTKKISSKRHSVIQKKHILLVIT